MYAVMQRPDWVSWGECQVAVCDRCSATYDLQTVPQEDRQEALSAFVTSHAFCKEDVGKRCANTITIRQQTALTLFATLLANNDEGASHERLAENALDAARVFCKTLSE
jgi:hypothetical protein